MTITLAITSHALLDGVIAAAAALARRRGARLCVATEDPKLRARERAKVGAIIRKLRASGLEVENRFEHPKAAHVEAELAIVAVAPRDAAGAASAFRIAKRGAPVPTLVLRDPRVLVAWLEDRERLRALACVDASAAGRATLRELAELRRDGSVDASVVHVADPAVEQARLGVPVRGAYRVLPGVVERALLTELRTWATHAGLNEAAVSYHVVRARRAVASQLAEIAHEHRAGLVIVGFGGTTSVKTMLRPTALKGLVALADNVLCVPTPAVSVATPIPRLASVLAATDLTPLGNVAISYAYAIAARGGTVHLVHALLDSADDAARVASRLRALIPSAAAESKITTEIHVEAGISEAAVLASIAERFVVDAICLSTTPRSNARKALAPSVAEEVLRRCRRPVLLVPPQRHER